MRYARSLKLTILFGLVLLRPAAGAVAPWPTEGWAQSTPEEQGMDSSLLQAGSSYILSQCPNRYSFVVVRNGYVVWEQYFHGMDTDRLADVMSISKSVLSMLIGQALDNGIIEKLEGKLADYFPEYFTVSTDPRKRQITLRHMLTMTAGFQWDEVETGNSWVASKDWYRFVIDLPMAATPGDVFDYNTGLSHLLAGVLSRASGETALAFGTRNLFEPLGIRQFRWDTDPRGNYVGGFHMYFSSRDLAKFGYLALRNGFWDGRQLVSREWIDDSTTAHTSYASPSTIGDYGYHWWVRSEWEYPAYMAAGFGGQYIFVVPGLDLVMVSTADTSSDTIDRHMQAFNLLTQYVIPAIKSMTDKHVSGKPQIERVVNGASYAGAIAPGGWATIFGANLSTSTRGWRQEDFAGGNLPVQLDGLSVTVGGRPAYVAYVSPEQINVVAPGGVNAGSATVNIVVAPGYSAAATAVVRDVAPALFLWKHKFAVAQHADYTPVGGTPLLPEIQATPAEPGETIVLYGTGFGSTGITGGIGELARQASPLATLPSVTIGDMAAKVEYAGIPEGGAGLYQINVTVPESAADGDLPVAVAYGGAEAPTALVSVRRRPNGPFPNRRASR